MTDLQQGPYNPSISTAPVRLQDGTGSVLGTVFDLSNSNPLAVAIVDANGDQITSFGGGTQYTEDAPAAANPVGTAVNLIRQDTPTALVTTDGDNVAQRGTNYGAAYIQVVTSTGGFVDSFGGGTQYADGAASATPTGTAAMGTDGSNVYVLHTDAAGDLQIDVLTMPTVTVQATNLDIRDLTFAADKVDISGSSNVGVTGPLTDAQLRASAVPISVASLPLPTGAATETTLGTRLSESDFDTKTGSLTEAAPASDTASSGLNGRLQRIAQRITSLIALIPTSLGQKTMANSLAVVVASDQSAIPASQNGTWTMQPGNTPNTAPWLMDMRRGQTILFFTIDTASSGDNTIVAASPGNKCKVLSYSLVCGGTVNVRWKNGASNISGAMPFVANTGISPAIGSPAGGWLLETSVNTALILNLSGAVQVSGHGSYILEA